MGFLKKASAFIDAHEREITMGELGLIGLLTGYLLTDPRVEVKVNDWMADKVRKAISNVHITYGTPKAIPVSGGKDKEPMGYYEYMDRREQRIHEERMAEIRAENAFINGDDGKVE